MITRRSVFAQWKEQQEEDANFVLDETGQLRENQFPWALRPSLMSIPENKRLRYSLTAKQCKNILQLAQEGFCIFENEVPHFMMQRFLADYGNAWLAQGNARKNLRFEASLALPDFKTFPGTEREYYRLANAGAYNSNFRLREAYEHFETAREILYGKEIVSFFRAIYEEEPMMESSYYMPYSSGMVSHQDFCFIRTSNPADVLTIWIALEDVQPNAGALFFYPRSHRIKKFDWGGGIAVRYVIKDNISHAPYHAYLSDLEARYEELGMKRIEFAPKAGTILLYQGGLIHGGMPSKASGLTRKSITAFFVTRRGYETYKRLEEPATRL